MRPRRTKAQLASQNAQVWELHLRGASMDEIARVIGRTTRTVHSNIASMYAERLAARKEHETPGAVLERELAKVDRLEQENWRGWERSKRDAEEVTEITRGGREPERRMKRRGQVGDHKFLDGAKKCAELRARLLGLGHEKTGAFGPVELVKVYIGGDPRDDV